MILLLRSPCAGVAVGAGGSVAVVFVGEAALLVGVSSDFLPHPQAKKNRKQALRVICVAPPVQPPRVPRGLGRGALGFS